MGLGRTSDRVGLEPRQCEALRDTRLCGIWSGTMGRRKGRKPKPRDNRTGAPSSSAGSATGSAGCASEAPPEAELHSTKRIHVGRVERGRAKVRTEKRGENRGRVWPADLHPPAYLVRDDDSGTPLSRRTGHHQHYRCRCRRRGVHRPPAGPCGRARRG